MKPYHESYFTDMKPPTKEEPVEGLAASLQDRIFNGFGSNGAPSNAPNDEQDYRSRNSSNASSPAMGSSQQLPTNMAYEIKTEPGIHLNKRSSSPSTLNKLPFKKQCTSNDYNEGASDKWQEVSRGFDRMIEFVSTELDKQQQKDHRGHHSIIESEAGKCVLNMVPTGPSSDTLLVGGGAGGGISCNTSPDSGVDLSSEPGCSNPPPLRRADSPPVLDGPPRTPSPCSPSPPVLPYSPAPLDGPYSPVPSSSPPPALQPSTTDINAKYQREDRHFKKKFFHHNKGKFRPKGKGWEWQRMTETEWY